MPVKSVVAVATVVVGSVMLMHPLTWKTELRKLQFSILREVTNTRSWGNPSIFQHRKVRPRAQAGRGDF